MSKKTISVISLVAVVLICMLWRNAPLVLTYGASVVFFIGLWVYLAFTASDRRFKI